MIGESYWVTLCPKCVLFFFFFFFWVPWLCHWKTENILVSNKCICILLKLLYLNPLVDIQDPSHPSTCFIVTRHGIKTAITWRRVQWIRWGGKMVVCNDAIIFNTKSTITPFEKAETREGCSDNKSMWLFSCSAHNRLVGWLCRYFGKIGRIWCIKTSIWHSSNFESADWTSMRERRKSDVICTTFTFYALVTKSFSSISNKCRNVEHEEKRIGFWHFHISMV